MTPPVESTPDEQATALSTTIGAESFLPGSGETAAPRSIGSWLLDYSAHAAMIVGLVGFAWTVSNHVVNRPAAPAATTSHAAAGVPKVDELTELRRSNQQMAEDIRRLRANLDQLGSAVRGDTSPAQLRVLQAGLDSVRNGLTSARGEANAAVAQVSGRLDKVEREPAGKLQQLSERVGRLEAGKLETGRPDRAAVDPAPTGSIAPRSAAVAAAVATVPTPPAKPSSAKPASAKLASLEEPRRAEEAKTQDAKAQDAKAQDGRPQEAKAENRPPVLPGYVVRDVYEGVAIIEGRRGPMEVVPGVSIPGAGVVKSIERRGSGWTVTTTKGLLAYAAPPKEYRRASRGYYPPYGAEF